MRDALTACLVVVVVCISACTPDAPRDIYNETSMDPGQSRIEVELDPVLSDYGVIYLKGIDLSLAHALSTFSPDADDWATFLKIYQHDTWLENPTVSPMMGRYRVEDGMVAFRPRFPLTNGLAYRVVFDEALARSHFSPAANTYNTILDTVFTVPRRTPANLTNIMQVYPSADTLPSNLLKFYIQFSGSMAEGVAYEHLSLIDKTSNLTIESPFVILEPELWDPEHKRFTLFFDPGRVKRSVGLNLELGPPLKAGHLYHLVVGQNWKDAGGQVRANDFVKAFHVSEADRNAPRVEDWEVITAPSSSRIPLTLSFPEPLDHALLQRLIGIYKVGGSHVDGMIKIGNQEQQWVFIPAEPWQTGTYEIRISAILEDVAGNTLRSLFDVDLQTALPSEVREATEVKTLLFEVL